MHSFPKSISAMWNSNSLIQKSISYDSNHYNKKYKSSAAVVFQWKQESIAESAWLEQVSQGDWYA